VVGQALVVGVYVAVPARVESSSRTDLSIFHRQIACTTQNINFGNRGVWQCPTDNSCYWSNDGQTQASCTDGCNGTTCNICPNDACTDGTACSGGGGGTARISPSVILAALPGAQDNSAYQGIRAFGPNNVTSD